MVPLFNELLARVVQGASRRIIELDEQAADRLKPVAGRVIEVMILPVGLQFFVCAEHDNLVVLDRYSGTVDATVSGRPSQFVDVMRAKGSAAAVRASGISIDGDIDVVEAFAEAVKHLDPDFEEAVSRVVGDGPARKLGVTARRLRNWFETTSHDVAEDAGFYLREDSGVLITAQALEDFANDVDELRADTDRLEQRIQQLQRGAS